MDFNTSISELGAVGKKTAKKFEHLGVKTAEDLLYYFPFRHEDYRKIVPIAQLLAGQMATICGQVELIGNKKSFRSRKTVTEALVSDKSGSIRVAWFNQPFIIKNIHAGNILYLSGKVKTDMFGPQLVSPIYEKYSKEKTTHTARLVPIYPTTYGLTQKQIRFLISQVIELAAKTKEWLPADILEKADLSPLSAALRGIHFPVDENELKISADRLKFDELFLIQIKAELSRRERISARAPVLIFKEDKIKDLVASLPFILTKPQKISAWEILQDIAKIKPMNRLVSGDVGSGKTIVAAMAIYNVFLNGYQAVMMAPTEILAQQHYDSLIKLFKGIDVSVALLAGSRAQKLQITNYKLQINSKIQNSKINKKEFLDQIYNGEIDVVVGTHALLSESVIFQKLGLVVVDEQHRFGVEQRRLIKQKGSGAHFLSMTATPIPRSLALMIYGDLDVSIINEMPHGRKKIITKIVEPAKRDKAYQFIRDQVALGRQVFVICPLIEVIEDERDQLSISPLKGRGIDPLLLRRVQSEVSLASVDKKSVMSEYEKLSKQIFPDLRVGYLHGRLKPAEKEKTMNDFKYGKLDILVSTSVVEVGVDIPNASVVMIEGAESFGLAQLHQFRGRVGRSTHQSYCFLFTNIDSTRVNERLGFFEQTHDGFKLAEKDLEMRGPGEVYGTEQSGEMNLRLAKLTDRELIKKALDAAKVVVVNMHKYAAVLDKIKNWRDGTHLE